MSRTHYTIGLGAVLLAAIVAQFVALQAPFFADDWLFLDQVRSRSLPAALASPDPIGNFLRPLGRQVWFWCMAHGSGESPWAFHAGNLVLFSGSIVLLARITRRVAGPIASLVAAAYFALHYAADVPVMWASGSQELVAVTLALGALELHLVGRTVLAGVALFLALLSKEAVAATPLVALMLDPAGGPFRVRARRAWPLGAAVVLWLAIVVPFLLTRPTPGGGLAPSAIGPLAVPVQLARVAAAIEWPTGGMPWWPVRDPGAAGLLSLVIALAGLVAATNVLATKRAAPRSPARGPAGSKKTAPTREVPVPPVPLGPDGVRAGLVWGLTSAIPVALIAAYWSAYYFLFAIGGIALALGSAVARTRRPAAWGIAAVALLGWSSIQARALTEFATAPSAWSAQSHVNRFYLDRGMIVVRRAVDDLRREVPRAEPRTTFFLAGVPAFAAVQVGDGPLVRGVYRDSSLRSYYLSSITREHLARGPWRILLYESKTRRLEDKTNTPGVLLSTALGMVLNGKLDAAVTALEAERTTAPPDRVRDYVTALVTWDLGDTVAAKRWFESADMRPVRGGLASLREVDEALARRDTSAAVLLLRAAGSEHVLEGALHARLSEVFLGRPESRPDGQLEAYAARVLSPQDGLAWRRWAGVLAIENRQEAALVALARYEQLAPAMWATDVQARQLAATLKRMLPGGDIAQRSLQRQLNP